MPQFGRGRDSLPGFSGPPRLPMRWLARPTLAARLATLGSNSWLPKRQRRGAPGKPLSRRTPEGASVSLDCRLSVRASLNLRVQTNEFAQSGEDLGNREIARILGNSV